MIRIVWHLESETSKSQSGEVVTSEMLELAVPAEQQNCLEGDRKTLLSGCERQLLIECNRVASLGQQSHATCPGNVFIKGAEKIQ